MNKKETVRNIARDVLQLADRRGYGLGECRYYFLVFAWDAMLDEYEELDAYDMVNNDGITWDEKKRLKANRPEQYDEWQTLANEAEELATLLQNNGITTIN